MRALRRILWWGFFIAGALVVQQSIPGIDALAPGFLMALQEKKPWQTFWIFVLFVLIQEGAGNLFFGSAVLWYGGQVLFFRLGQRLFVADNLLFVLMLAASLAGYRAVLTVFMCMVQKIPLDYVMLLQDCAVQAAIIPVVWSLAYFTRPKTAVSAG